MDHVTDATCIFPTGRQIYQPQFGMGNQLRALEAGLAVARILGRLLVIPDYISDNGEGATQTRLMYGVFGTWRALERQPKTLSETRSTRQRFGRGDGSTVQVSKRGSPTNPVLN